LLQRAFQALLTSAAAYQTRQQAWDVVQKEEEQSRPAWRQHTSYTPPQERVRQAWLSALKHFHQAKQEFIRVSDTLGLEAFGIWLGSLSPRHQPDKPNAPRLDMAEVTWVLAAFLDSAETDELNTPSNDRRHLAFLKAAMNRGKKLLTQVEQMQKTTLILRNNGRLITQRRQGPLRLAGAVVSSTCAGMYCHTRERKHIMAQLIHPNGTTQAIRPQGKSFTIKELQRLIGGYVVRVPLRDGQCLLVDEDGLPRQLPLNRAATKLAHLPGDVIVGKAVLLTAQEQKGVF
jgi:hypothetical protein